ncbi:hypothetical protein ACI3L1_06685 [Deinococcus sp. SM5_A1]|uniref:hypothetical protein n=1 Tax=Deinococcus sp. SM5_A1 TaxID=3379094 RepID=UPI00385E63E4
MKKTLILMGLSLTSALLAAPALARRDYPTGDRTGTHSLSDLSAITNQTINEFGREAVADSINADLEAHNVRMTEMTMGFADQTTEREEPQPINDDARAKRVDEVGRVSTKKADPPGKVGYPLDTNQYAVGWTADYLLTATPAEMATTVLTAELAMLQEHISGIRGALMNPVNYTHFGYVDDKTETSVKALYNGDGQVPPRSPNLTNFTGSHNHYLASATLTEAVASALVMTVAEHTINGNLVTLINPADAAAWKALSGFVPLMDARVRVALDQSAGVAGLDTANATERDIGYYDGSVVRTRGWIPVGYSICQDVNATSKVLRRRVPRQPVRQGLRVYTGGFVFPLQADYFVEQFGYGVRNRGAAAVLDFSHVSYTKPAGL